MGVKSEHSKSLEDLTEIIRLTEDVSTKLYGQLNHSQIFEKVAEEFSKSKSYDVIIAALTDCNEKLQFVTTSIAKGVISKAVEITGRPMDDYLFDLSSTGAMYFVIKEAKTVFTPIEEFLESLFPNPLVKLILKLTGFSGQRMIITPIFSGGTVVGAISVNSASMEALLEPSVRNLAKHISNALEIAKQQKENEKHWQELKESREVYHSLFEHKGSATVIVEEDTTILEVNKKFEELSGYKKSELEGKFKFPQFVAPEDRKRLEGYHYARRKNENAAPNLYEAGFITKEGKRLVAKVNVGMEPNEKRTIVSFIDVTEYDNLREEVKHHADIVDRVEDAVVEVSSSGVISRVNNGALKMTGFNSKSEMVGLRASSLVAKEEKERVAKYLNDLDKIDSDELHEFKFVKRNGEEFYGELKATKVENGADGQKSLVILVRDITKRRKADESLKLTQFSMNAIGTCIFRLTKDGRFVYVNDTVLRKLGYTRENLIGKHIWEVNPNYTKEGRAEFWQKLKKAGVLNFHSMQVTKEGRVYPVEINSNYIKYGNTEYEFSFAYDISDKVEAQMALKTSEEKYHKLFNNLSDAVFVHHPKPNKKPGILIEVNSAANAMLGYSREEFLKMTPADFTYQNPKDKENPSSKAVKEIMDKGSYRGERVFVTKSGDKLPVEINSFKFFLEGKPTILTIARDIRETKLAQEKLEEEKNRAQKYLDVAGVILIAFDKTGSIQLANNKALDVTGYSEEEIIGKNWIQLLVPQHLREEMTRVFKSIINGEEKEYGHNENPILTKSGEERQIVWHNAVLKDADGKVTGVISSGEDITERREAEDALRFTQTTADKASVGIFWLDKNWRVRYANDAACKKMGYTKEEVLNLYVPDFDPDWDFEKLHKHWEHLKKAGVLTFESRNMTKDGKIFPVEITDHYIKFGDIEYDFVFIKGITERKEAERKVKDSYSRLRKTFGATVEALSSLTEKRDPYTAGHQQRVTKIAVKIAERMKLSQQVIEGIQVASSIHDIGKVYVPAEILSKPGRLNELEYSIIKTHPQVSYDVLKNIDFPWPIAEIVYQHHERFDGSGYPRGLKGEEILLEARIIAVADVVEAMSSHRPYRPSLGIKEAIAEIKKNKGKYYDAKVVDTCCGICTEEGWEL